jgi:hypothetical protein
MIKVILWHRGLEMSGGIIFPPKKMPKVFEAMKERWINGICFTRTGEILEVSLGYAK